MPFEWLIPSYLKFKFADTAEKRQHIICHDSLILTLNLPQYVNEIYFYIFPENFMFSVVDIMTSLISVTNILKLKRKNVEVSKLKMQLI